MRNLGAFHFGSKWFIINCSFLRSVSKAKDDARFKCREDAIEFMDLMLKHKMFHRARKIPVPDKKKKAKDKKDKKGGEK